MKFVLSILLLLGVFSDSYAQSVLNTSVVSMCGCPGEVWDFSIPYQPKVSFSTATNSKRLMHTDYGFNIPASATVTGIKASFSYSCNNFSPGSLNDSLCTLMLNGNLVGDDHNYQTSYYTGTGTANFGGPSDLWGQAIVLTPYNINSAGFGFNFKLFSAVANATFALLNGVQITVYYADVSGIREQSSSSEMKIISSGHQLKFEGIDESSSLKIFDTGGKVVFQAEVQMNGSIDTSSLENGIYFCHIHNHDKTRIIKILITE